jgi:hypothetical protein
LRRHVAGPPSVPPGISMRCVATTAATYAPAPLKLAILSYEGSSPGKDSTSSRPCGKAHSGLRTFPGLARHGWRQRRVFQCQTHGSSNISTSSTRELMGTNEVELYMLQSLSARFPLGP